ncbi:MAG: hypothetical protein ACKVZJ_15870 [Phycisphaerales bacterium]
MLFDKSRLSLALAGWRAPLPASLRPQIEWATSSGLRCLTLNAAAADCRPRDLGRSARRDIAALVRRSSMSIAGVDLWLPPEHLTDPAHADRALAALLDAVDLAADFEELSGGAEDSSAVLSTALPDDAPSSLLSALRERALARSVRLADHRWPAPKAESIEPPLLIGLDPARMFISEGPKADPAAAASRLGPLIASARLSDANSAGCCAVGALGTRLDVMAYLVALSTAGYRGPLVVDVRAVEGQERAIRAAVRAACVED